MKTDKNIALIRQEFFDFYYLFYEKEIIKEDIISMGNLALFVDYSINRYKWSETKKNIKDLANQRDKNELNMILADNLYLISNRLELSDNLEFKMKKLYSLYKKNKLMYFDIVLDPYEFPEWFNRVIEYYPIPSKKELYMKLLQGFEEYSELMNRGNQLSLAYFIDKFYNDKKFLQLVTDLDYKLQYENLNELSWFMANNIFRHYYPELTRLREKEEQEYSLKILKKYKTLYHLKELNTFDIFSKSKKENINISFLQETT